MEQGRGAPDDCTPSSPLPAAMTSVEPGRTQAAGPTEAIDWGNPALVRAIVHVVRSYVNTIMVERIDRDVAVMFTDDVSDMLWEHGVRPASWVEGGMHEWRSGVGTPDPDPPTGPGSDPAGSGLPDGPGGDLA